MIAEIKASGVIVISSETELEAFALRMWLESNEDDLPENIIIKSSFEVDCDSLSYSEIDKIIKGDL